MTQTQETGGLEARRLFRGALGEISQRYPETLGIEAGQRLENYLAEAFGDSGAEPMRPHGKPGRKPGPPHTQVSIRIARTLMAQVRACAIGAGCTASEVIRRAVTAYFEEP